MGPDSSLWRSLGFWDMNNTSNRRWQVLYEHKPDPRSGKRSREKRSTEADTELANGPRKNRGANEQPTPHHTSRRVTVSPTAPDQQKPQESDLDDSRKQKSSVTYLLPPVRVVSFSYCFGMLGGRRLRMEPGRITGIWAFPAVRWADQ